MSSNPAIHRIPEEILRVIFLLTPNDAEPCQAVCRLWRELIINIPHFWTKITITGGRSGSASLEDIFTAQCKRATRAGLLPLDVSWNLKMVNPEITENALAAIAAFFQLAPTNRWRSLDVGFVGIPWEYCSSEYSQLGVLSLPRFHDGLVPLLESLNQSCTSLDKLHIAHNWTGYEPHIPNLLSQIHLFDLQGFHGHTLPVLPRNISHVILRETVLKCTWNDIMVNVTNLTIEDFFIGRVGGIEMPNLEYLEITENVEIIKPSDLSFPKLLCLNIPTPGLPVLFYFDMPKLQTLKVHRSSWEKRSPSIDMNDVLVRDLLPSTISTFALLDYVMADTICDTLDQLSTVKELEVLLDTKETFEQVVPFLMERVDFQMQRAATLSEQYCDVYPCPDLEYLVIRIEEEWDKADLTLACRSLLNARKSSGMKKIKVIKCNGDVMEVVVELAA